MLAPATLSPDHAAWNRRWSAPFGNRFKRYLPESLHMAPLVAQALGPFAFQRNSTTRAFEYPWAFGALALSPGLSVLEIGGGLSGFQFVLSKAGCRVTNVDPGMAARGRGWPCTQQSVARLNRRFGTDVELRNCFMDEAGLEDRAFDRLVSVSVIEHIPEADLVTLLSTARRVLRPGGLFVITLDLFLDLAPFTDRFENEFGHNISARFLVEKSGLELAAGDPRELFGYDEFDPIAIADRRAAFLTGAQHPAMVQTMVLRKPAAA